MYNGSLLSIICGHVGKLMILIVFIIPPLIYIIPELVLSYNHVVVYLHFTKQFQIYKKDHVEIR
jgi:hypothetical protein